MDKSAGEISLSIKLKSFTIGSIECVNYEALIPGLPDELALICLAKISHGFLGVLECVCKRWRDVIRSEEYVLYKSRMGWCGDWLFVWVEENDRNRYWKAYDPEADRWHPLPPMPRGNALVGFSCVSVCNRLLVIGGFCYSGQIRSSNQVFNFDPYRQEWSEVAGMSTGRAFFACSVICDKVYVGGGYSSTYSQLSSAEFYDPVKDRWDELPTMPNPRDWCFGVSYNNKFYILSEGRCHKIMDIFCLHDRQWCSRRDVRKKLKQTKYHILVIDGHLYTIIGDSLQTVNIETGLWYQVGLVLALTLPENPWLTVPICGLRNKLYVIGEMAISPYQPDHLVRQRRNKLYVTGRMAAINPYQPDHLVRQRTQRLCDLSTTPLQWKKSMFPSVNSVRTLASLEECKR